MIPESVKILDHLPFPSAQSIKYSLALDAIFYLKQSHHVEYVPAFETNMNTIDGREEQILAEWRESLLEFGPCGCI